MIAVGPYLVVPDYGFVAARFGLGFYVILVASVLALAISFWPSEAAPAKT